MFFQPLDRFWLPPFLLPMFLPGLPYFATGVMSCQGYKHSNCCLAEEGSRHGTAQEPMAKPGTHQFHKRQTRAKRGRVV